MGRVIRTSGVCACGKRGWSTYTFHPSLAALGVLVISTNLQITGFLYFFLSEFLTLWRQFYSPICQNHLLIHAFIRSTNTSYLLEHAKWYLILGADSLERKETGKPTTLIQQEIGFTNDMCKPGWAGAEERSQG